MISTVLAATAAVATASAAGAAGNQAAASIADGSLLVALPIAALAGLISFCSANAGSANARPRGCGARLCWV